MRLAGDACQAGLQAGVARRKPLNEAALCVQTRHTDPEGQAMTTQRGRREWAISFGLRWISRGEAA